MKKLILFLKNIFIQTESENDFMLSLNNYLETHTNELWKDASEIAVITGVTESEVIKNIDLFEGLAENSKGQFTTKNFYVKRTPFLRKLSDQIINRIE